MAKSELKIITQDLEKAGVLIANSEMKLGQMGHSKAPELERLRSKLNNIIRSMKPYERHN